MKTKSPFVLLCVAFSFASRAFAVDFTVINTDPTGPGSLAQAITDANNLPGPDRVIFNIFGAGVQTITVSAPWLPLITEALEIDGYTQPGSLPNTLATGSNAVVLIRIHCSGQLGDVTAPDPVGIWVAASDCTIRGLILSGFPQAGQSSSSKRGGFGIRSTGDRCVIEGNFIGTDAASSTGLGNHAGIRISGSGWRIGGTALAARNVIGGNNMGIWAGTFAVPPAEPQRGVITGNHIGRYVPAAGGSSPGSEGIGNASGIVLMGTFIETVIGGTAQGARNIISGNFVGISTGYTGWGNQGFQTYVATGVIVQGNLIGADPLGMGGMTTGIELYGSDHLIGGTEAGAGNLIGSNQVGISLSGANSMIFGNDIMANVDRGISIISSADNHIGSLAAGAGNHIHMNGVGIVVLASQQNRILSNIIEDNSVAAIDLGNDGPTSNDFGDGDNGPNGFQNFPTVVTSHDAAGNTTFSGGLNSAASSASLFSYSATSKASSNSDCSTPKQS